MAIGLRFAVGTHAPETGRYAHTACLNVETFYRGDILAPCVKDSCPKRRMDWILQEKYAVAHGGHGPGEAPLRTSL